MATTPSTTEPSELKDDDAPHRWEVEPHPYSRDFDYFVTDNDAEARAAILEAAEMYLWDGNDGEERTLRVTMNKDIPAIANSIGECVERARRVYAPLDTRSRAAVATQPPYDGSMTPEQLERSTLIAESRGIDLDTAQELVYLRDRVGVAPPVDAETGLNLFRQLVRGKNALRTLGVFPCNQAEHEDVDCECFWEQCEAWAKLDAATPSLPVAPTGDNSLLSCPFCGGEGFLTEDDAPSPTATGVATRESHSFSCQHLRQEAFKDYLPLTAVRVAPGEYEIKSRDGRTLWCMEGAALADWVCASISGYDAAMRGLRSSDEDLRYAQRLAKHLAATHFPEVQDFNLLDTVSGVLSQIDNMICAWPATSEVARAAAEEIADYVGDQLGHVMAEGDRLDTGPVVAIITKHLCSAAVPEHEHDFKAWTGADGLLCWCGAVEKAGVIVKAGKVPAGLVPELQKRLFDECRAASWDPDLKNTFAEEIAHLHEELSEAFRAWRRYKDCEIREVNGKLEGVPIEFADALIGIFYNAELHGFDLLEAVERKHQFNLSRNYVEEGRQLHAPVTDDKQERTKS